MLQRIGDEAAVQPGLVHVADVEPEGFGDAVVVDAERPAQMDRKAVDVLALEPGVVERLLERLAASRSWLSGRPRPNALLPMPTIAAVAQAFMRSPVRPQHDAPGCLARPRSARAPAPASSSGSASETIGLTGAARHQREAVLELAARGAGRADSIERFLRKSCAGLNGTNWPVSWPIRIQRPPMPMLRRSARRAGCRHCRSRHRRRRRRCARLHRARKILAARMHDRPHARRASRICVGLLRRGRLRDDKRAGEPRELHGVHAEPAARAGDERALARCELARLRASR